MQLLSGLNSSGALEPLVLNEQPSLVHFLHFFCFISSRYYSFKYPFAPHDIVEGYEGLNLCFCFGKEHCAHSTQRSHVYDLLSEPDHRHLARRVGDGCKNAR